jgi:hypothetical protein
MHKKGVDMNMKMIIVMFFMTMPAVYCMNNTSGELIECTNKLKAKRQELDTIVKNNDNSQAAIALKDAIIEAINTYELDKQVVHHRIIHRGIEPEKLNKAKL